MTARTLFDKIWDRHQVCAGPEGSSILYIDLHLVHEVTSPQAFDGLRARGLKVRRPGLTIATTDHSTPTTPRSFPIVDKVAAAQVARLESSCKEFGIRCFGLSSSQQGIVHVIGPEQGLTQPGMTVVCGDSHTATHGAFGALAFGIGTTEVEHVLATQCLLQNRSKTYEVRVDGALRPGITAKDIILSLIARIGIGGGTGCVFEYCGSAIRALSMEERMTICNMSIEAGARAGLIAPDDTTYQYVSGRPYAPENKAWDAAVASWRKLPTDEGAQFDKSITIDAAALEPMITFGTNPGMGIGITARQAAARPPGGCNFHWKLHQLAHLGSAQRRENFQRPQSAFRRTRDGGPRLARSEGTSASRGPRSDLPRCGRRLARGRLLDVHRDEWRSVAARRVQRLHQQS
jgi:3-isopropylmalate/(R)-2-methylmalate dehydratase large subunit